MNHERVIRAYRELAENEPKRVVVIDGRLSAGAVEKEIWRQLVNHFPILARPQPSTIRP